MNHSSRSDEPYLHGYVPFQLELGNGLLHSSNHRNLNQQENDHHHHHHSKPIRITRTIDTGIIYLPLPEPKLQLVKPQQSIDFKHQIEQDFSIRYQYFNDNELNDIFYNIKENDTDRYKISYRRLYNSLLESISKCVDINEDISQIKLSIIYKNELLPMLIHNHKLAKREKKSLYNVVTRTWQKFDERIQNEINVQYQIEQIKKEHQDLTNMKIKQEQYQAVYFKLHEIKNDINYLKRDQLQEEIQEIKNRSSHNRIQLDLLKSNTLRSRTYELNNLQLERDSLITQTELIKYSLFEQIQQFDNILNNYRTSLNSFRSTVIELEQQLRQQTDNELINLRINSIRSSSFMEYSINKKDSVVQQRLTIKDDSQRLIIILENKINEKQSSNIQLQKLIDEFQQKIVKQKQFLIKKENDYTSMDNIDQQLNHNINICREIYQQLKTERRTLERQLTLKSKQYSNDDRHKNTLIQQHDSLLAREKLEQLRTNTLNERIHPLIEENDRLKTLIEQLNREYLQINPNNLIQLQEKIIRLRQIHQTFTQQKIMYQYTKKNYEKLDKQLETKNNRVNGRITNILNRMNQNEMDFKDNYQCITKLENELSEAQHHFLQSKYFSNEMKNRSESHKTSQKLIQMQTQVVSNKIKHAQYRLNSFDEQISMCGNDLVEQHTSMNKLREFHSVLKEQDEIGLKKLSTIYNQLVSLQYQYKASQKSLKQTTEDFTKCLKVRSILGRMVVRRVNLCQLLYKKLARIDKHIHQRERNIQIIAKCINSLIPQIHQIRDQNKKFIERKDKLQLETVRVHVTKMLDRSHEKQMLLTQQIFERRFQIKPSLDPLPTEELTYLRTKFYLLKNRLIKIICRGIICNLVLISIQQEFSDNLEYYKTKSPREKYSNLNSIRTNLYQLMRQLKAKTAENNMLIDYRCCVQLIHTDTIQQLTQWKNINSTDKVV